MRFGTFHIFPKPPDLTEHQVIHQTLAEIEHAEILGFDNIWLTEHHASPFGLCASPSVLAAAAAMRTQRVGIGYAVNVSPLHHPLRLAEDIALVDQLSNGRVIAGFGPGYSPYEFNMYNVNVEQRHNLHNETLNIVLKAWAGKPFDHTGNHFRFQHAVTFPGPYQKPHPPIAVAAGSPDSIAHTAHAGHRLMLLVGPERIPELIGLYRQTARETGRDTHLIENTLQHTTLLRNIHVAPTDEQAQQNVRAPTEALLRLRNRLAGQETTENEFASMLDDYLTQRTLLGAPETVVEHIRALKSTGIGELLCWFKWGSFTHAQTVTSMNLFAEQVIPHI
ncbi:MAG: LLM class flavin-dependent oxidoreductase [bacterium]|nr:LLM class flavin-dependent oxidoreductase [bacterium]